ncbi:hypothetical protein [Candidatus Thiodiazotropha sp. CDECU1]|uniref:hypothetical protein n=1 Tax=Candidatus Thiodiazotropha sp. CDECU1 TaxID=3065865 RepID=UPI00292CD589|nr:hypothetical protein [Candidatus Thiodiazotropha sp. CDECU1]
MAVTIDDHGVRFIRITLGEVGISRDRLCIDGFTETGHADDSRHFMKSWSEFDKCSGNRQAYDKKAS